MEHKIIILKNYKQLTEFILQAKEFKCQEVFLLQFTQEDKLYNNYAKMKKFYLYKK